MSHPTRSASTGKDNGLRRDNKLQGSQRPPYRVPTIQTYGDKRFVKDDKPARRLSGLQPHHA